MEGSLGAFGDSLLHGIGSGAATPEQLGEVVRRALERQGARRVELLRPGGRDFVVRLVIDEDDDDDLGEIVLSVRSRTDPRGGETSPDLELVDLLRTYEIRTNRRRAIRADTFVTRLSERSLRSVMADLGAPAEAEALLGDGDPGDPVPKVISATVAPDAEVEAGRRVSLRIKVGDPVPDSLFEGQDVVLPATDIPPEGLDTEWHVCSSDFTFEGGGVVEAHAVSGDARASAARFSLHVPHFGESETVELALTPREPGTGTLQFLVLVKGQLYRMLTAELEVGGDETGRAATFSKDLSTARADRIGAPTRNPCAEPAWLQIVIEGSRALLSGRLPGESIPPTWVPWSVGSGQLDDAMARARRALERLREQHGDTYLNAIDNDDLKTALADFEPVCDWERLTLTDSQAARDRWDTVRKSPELGDLAVYGRALYDYVFGSGDVRDCIDRLPPGAVLSITWADAEKTADVPWTLMYALEQDEEIDPLGFLGLRFRLRYFAYERPRAILVETFIGTPEETSTECCLFWGAEPGIAEEAKTHRELAEPPKRSFIPAVTPDAEPKEQLLDSIKAKATSPGPAVLYLFCKYGEDSFRFGDNNDDANMVSLEDLMRSSLKPIPLIFANACETGGVDAYHVHPIKQRFFNQGAGAFIGTEARVPIAMASRVGTALLSLFDGRPGVEPLTVGEALTQTRLLLWRRYLNIGGLFYSMVNEDALQRRSKSDAKLPA